MVFVTTSTDRIGPGRSEGSSIGASQNLGLTNDDAVDHTFTLLPSGVDVHLGSR